MKLGCAVSTYETQFGPIVFKDGNLAENFRLMQKYGYKGVDLFIKQSTTEQLKEYRSMMDSYGLSVTTLFAIYLGEQGVRLTEKDDALRAKYVDMMKVQLENAVTVGAKGLGLGFIRGMHYPDETEADALKRLAEPMREIGAYAAEIGTNLLLEPINRYEINTLNRATDAVDFIRNNELKGVILQPDMFHMNIEDKDIADSIRYAGDLVGNLHISSSNRYAVGTGHFDFAPIVQALHDINYDGVLTFEGFAPDAEEALAMTAQNMAQYL